MLCMDDTETVVFFLRCPYPDLCSVPDTQGPVTLDLTWYIPVSCTPVRSISSSWTAVVYTYTAVLIPDAAGTWYKYCCSRCIYFLIFRG